MNDKKNYFIAVGILVFLCTWLLCRVYNNGISIQSAYEQSERVREYQSEIIRQLSRVEQGISTDIERIKRAEERTETITDSAIGIQEHNSNIYNAIRDSQQRITDSKRILEEIGKTKK